MRVLLLVLALAASAYAANCYEFDNTTGMTELAGCNHCIVDSQEGGVTVCGVCSKGNLSVCVSVTQSPGAAGATQWTSTECPGTSSVLRVTADQCPGYVAPPAEDLTFWQKLQREWFALDYKYRVLIVVGLSIIFLLCLLSCIVPCCRKNKDKKKKDDKKPAAKKAAAAAAPAATPAPVFAPAPATLAPAPAPAAVPKGDEVFFEALSPVAPAAAPPPYTDFGMDHDGFLAGPVAPVAAPPPPTVFDGYEAFLGGNVPIVEMQPIPAPRI